MRVRHLGGVREVHEGSYLRQIALLCSVLELLKLKDMHGWSDSSFKYLLGLLRVLFPKPNLLPSNTYLLKKLICPLSLGVQKRHACVNHYVPQGICRFGRLPSLWGYSVKNG